MKTKKLVKIAIVLTCCLVWSCNEKFDDSRIWSYLNSLEVRIAKMEELVKQMNTNVSSLQAIMSALQENDYITSVTPITKENDVVGYTICFLKSSPITIYNGKDGKDGNTPQIGISSDVDGNRYWTLNGEWLIDDKGNKVIALAQNGKDGVTPLLKIENDSWYLSMDEGKTWTVLGQATGDKGDEGENLFTSILFDTEKVTFTTNDGSVFALPLYIPGQDDYDPTNHIGKENKHTWVDLGLPSGTLWATCNVGANKPEEIGDYYAWGEIAVKKNGYIKNNYKFYHYVSGYTKYKSTDSVLEDVDNVARYRWGGQWDMPTEKQMNELINNCYCEYKEYKGVLGYIITSARNESYIFIPVSGYIDNMELISNSSCFCWTKENEYFLSGGQNRIGVSRSLNRYNGLPVRPVLIKQNK